jgi:hypothetical protein
MGVFGKRQRRRDRLTEKSLPEGRGIAAPGNQGLFLRPVFAALPVGVG